VGCLIVLVGIAYLLGGVVFGAVWHFETKDWLGDGESRIDNPDLRDRVERFKLLAQVLWVGGGMVLAFGAWQLSQSLPLSQRRKRILLVAMVGVPLLWLVVSLWTINEGEKAVGRSNPTPVPGVVWSVVSGPPGGTPPITSSAPVVARIEFDGYRLRPGRVVIPAESPVTIIFVTQGNDLNIDIPELDIGFYLGYDGTVALTLIAPPGEWAFWGETEYRANNVPGGVLMATSGAP
jgi:hypothetical protein